VFEKGVILKYKVRDRNTSVSTEAESSAQYEKRIDDLSRLTLELSRP